VPIRVRGTEWYLCGTDDARARRYDLEATLRGVPAGAFRVLLCHEPDMADEAAKRGIPLQLSGHSHGGQVALPRLGPLILPRLGRRYPRGLEQVPGSRTKVFTSLGVGVVGPPIRLGCPPEVALLTLTRA
jgi:predicted MPP superfamily phosphohydrolase